MRGFYHVAATRFQGRSERSLDRKPVQLVVYDMQVGIISQLPHGSEVLSRVLEVLNIARGHGFRVFFLRHMSLPTKLAGVFQLRQAMTWQRVEKPELAPEVGVRVDEAIFDKISMSAHEGTPLALTLRNGALISFMICGSQCSGQRRKSHSRYSAAMGTGIGRGPIWSVTRGRTTDVSKDALAPTRNHSA